MNKEKLKTSGSPVKLDPCPKCSASGRDLLFSTPVNDDGIVEEARIICLNCPYKGPSIELNAPLEEVNKMQGLAERLAAYWNNKILEDGFSSE